MKINKRSLSVLFTSALSIAVLAGCTSKPSKENTNAFDSSETININSREDGSGTRSAFTELFDIQEENNGEKIDATTSSAAITDSTAVMMSTVAEDPYSIGYISFGSLNDTVKAVPVDGAEISIENIKDGTYKISRVFNLVEKDDLSHEAQDFKEFILSKDGQAVVKENGYVPMDTDSKYEAKNLKGKIVVSGSSSVTPVMEKLKEAYNKLNPDVEIEVQQSDSSTGITNAADGTCDLGMSSRELKDEEIDEGLIPTPIAHDGIALIVNEGNPIESISSEDVKNIYTGKIETWNEVKN